MEIVKNNKNELLKRREVSVVVRADGNPGFSEAKENLASHFKEELDKIVVNNVYSKFGSKSFFIDALIYDSVSDKERIEPKKKEKKGAKK